jgi:hypothetical protein
VTLVEPQQVSSGVATGVASGVAIRSFFSPIVYLIVLSGIYALSFVQSPLGWWESVHVDGRHLLVYVSFVASFLMGMGAASLPRPAREGLTVELRLDEGATLRFVAVVFFSLICLAALALKAGGFAIFADNATIFRRDFAAAMGGFVIYPTFLLTALAVIALCQFAVSRRLGWLVAWMAIVALQVMQYNRQELAICVIAPLLVTFFDKRASVLRVAFLGLGALAIAYVLGTLAITRYGGAEFISRSIPAHELPLWVFLGDLTGTVRLGHMVADIVGSGGLGGWYVWGVFASIFLPEVPHHGALAIRDAFTSSQTAQSIPAPLSYYADGGLALVATLGFAQGALLQFLWRKAVDGYVFSRIVYVLGVLAMMWTLRSGTVLFSPIVLFQVAAMSFIFGHQIEWRRWPRLVLRAAAGLFVLAVPICLAALALRL